MSTILLSWLIVIVGALIIEVLTTMFYGLALSLAATVTAIYVAFSGETSFTLVQGLIFVISTIVFSYVLPKILVSKAPDIPQGADRYVGEKRSAKKVGGDLKISLDGVDYLIESDEEIKVGDKVEVTSHKGASMRVKRIAA